MEIGLCLLMLGLLLLLGLLMLWGGLLLLPPIAARASHHPGGRAGLGGFVGIATHNLAKSITLGRTGQRISAVARLRFLGCGRRSGGRRSLGLRWINSGLL